MATTGGPMDVYGSIFHVRRFVALLVVCGAGCGVGGLSLQVDGSDGDGSATITMLTHRDQAPAWAVGYGAEFWRRRSAAGPGVDVGDVLDRVSHAITREDDNAPPRVATSTYAVAFDGRGIRFSPSAASGAEAHLRTTRVQIGNRDVYRDDDRLLAWSLLGNTAQVLLGNVVEHHEVRGDGVEMAWVLADRPASGDLVVEVEVEAFAYETQTTGGTHFVDRVGRNRIRVGNAELVDAAGDRWPVTTDVIEGRLRWRVEHEILAAATFPVALDPLVGPELALDEPVLVAAAGDQTRPQVAFNGNRYLVVWGVNPLGIADVYGARVSTTGQIEDPLGIAISTADGDQWTPKVASNGADFLVTWEDARNVPSWVIYAARVTDAGVVMDPTGIPISNGTDPAVASDGTDYLVVWGAGDIYAARVTAGGVADASAIPVSVEPGGQTQAAVGSNGSEYVVVWSDRRGGSSAESNIYGARVTLAGAVPASDSHGIPISMASGDQQTPSIASNGTDYLVTWSDRRVPEFDVYGARFTSAGTVAAADVGGIPIGTGAARQGSPATASTGTDYFVAWLHNDRAVYGARVTAAGVVPTADAGGISIAQNTSTDPYVDGYPSVASDGVGYLVAWTEDTETAFGSGDVFVARVTATGTVQDQPGVLVSTGWNAQLAPSVASNGTDFLVVWSEDRNVGGTGIDVYGARVSATGDFEDVAPIEISRADDDQVYPAVASNGTDYFVAWSTRNDNGYVPGVVGARVTADGVIPASDMAGISVSTTAAGGSVSIASNGTDYLVAWFVYTTTGSDIFGTRVTASGSVPPADVAGFAISTATGTQAGPAVASNGTDYLVVWYDSRNSTDYDLYGARVTAAGTVTDADGFAISTAARRQYGPAVTSNGIDYFVAWTDERADSGDIYGARVTSMGTIPASDAAGIGLATGVSSVAGYPALAFNGADYFLTWVGWTDFIGGTGEISGKPITQAGVASPAIAIGTTTGTSTRLQIAGHSGMPYLVAYTLSSRIAARLVTSCGNSVVDADETCDDGNTTPADGCSVTCTSESGYTCSGSPSTCADVDECATNNGGCAQLCTNAPGSFSCGCMPGYVLDADGFTCDDIDECTLSNGGCAVGVMCTNLPGSYECGDCPPGYTGDGVTCTDIDECATNNGGCAQTCTNSEGSYLCSCAGGYELAPDAHACDDIDECATNNGGCSLDPLVSCTNLPGSFTCGECPAGFSGDGATCLDVDECAGHEDDCAAVASCTNTRGGFTCACLTGFVGDGRSCEPEPEPEPMPEPGGCGCRASGPREPAIVLFVLVLMWGRRRRTPARR